MAAPTEIQRSVALRDTFVIGYQNRQFGVAGADVLLAMTNPPTAMVTAETVTDDNTPPA